MSNLYSSDLIKILRHSVFGGDAPDIEITPEIVKLAKKHHVAHLLPVKDGILYSAVVLCARQVSALDEIVTALDAEGIKAVPLKGSVLRNYYPQPWMRYCCDLDVLVSKPDFKKACGIMESLGYEKGKTDVCDVTFKKDMVAVELHFSVSEYNEPKEAMSKLSDYYNHSDELLYLFHIFHMYKHFNLGGCGIRSLMDITIMKQHGLTTPVTDDLKDFAADMERIAELWFEKGEYTGSELEEYIINGGAFGTMEQRVARRSSGLSRNEYLAKRIFMPYDDLKFEYPVLQKHRWLTPVCEVRRWSRFLSKDGRARMMAELVEVKKE